DLPLPSATFGQRRPGRAPARRAEASRLPGSGQPSAGRSVGTPAVSPVGDHDADRGAIDVQDEPRAARSLPGDGDPGWEDVRVESRPPLVVDAPVDLHRADGPVP